MASFKIDWKGNLVVKLTEKAIENIIADLGEIAEAESKRELTPGHGVISGDLRGSIRLGVPSTIFGETHGEHGGQRVIPIREGKRYVLALGSGMPYSMAIHQGWPSGYPGLRGQFAGYHYLTKGVERTNPQVQVVVLRNRIK